jgi:hypothetical protein
VSFQVQIIAQGIEHPTSDKPLAQAENNHHHEYTVHEKKLSLHPPYFLFFNLSRSRKTPSSFKPNEGRQVGGQRTSFILRFLWVDDHV